MIYDYVRIASCMLGAGACLECIVIMTGYVLRNVLRMIRKGGE